MGDEDSGIISILWKLALFWFVLNAMFFRDNSAKDLEGQISEQHGIVRDDLSKIETIQRLVAELQKSPEFGNIASNIEKNVRENIITLINDTLGKIDELKKKVDPLTATDFTDINRQLLELQTRMNDYDTKTDIDAINSNIQDIRATQARLAAELSKYTTKEAMVFEMNQLREHITRISETPMEELKKQIETMQANLARVQSTITNLQTNNDSYEQLKEQVGHIQRDYSSVSEQLQIAKATFGTLPENTREKLISFEQNIKQILLDIETMKGQKKTQDQQIIGLKETLNSTEENLKIYYGERIEEILEKLENTTSKDEAKKLEDKIDKYVEAYHDSIRIFHESKDDWTSRLDAYRIELEALKNSIQTISKGPIGDVVLSAPPSDPPAPKTELECGKGNFSFRCDLEDAYKKYKDDPKTLTFRILNHVWERAQPAIGGSQWLRDQEEWQEMVKNVKTTPEEKIPNAWMRAPVRRPRGPFSPHTRASAGPREDSSSPERSPAAKNAKIHHRPSFDGSVAVAPVPAYGKTDDREHGAKTDMHPYIARPPVGGAADRRSKAGKTGKAKQTRRALSQLEGSLGLLVSGLTAQNRQKRRGDNFSKAVEKELKAIQMKFLKQLNTRFLESTKKATRSITALHRKHCR